jgi:hypothetical protein
MAEIFMVIPKDSLPIPYGEYKSLGGNFATIPKPLRGKGMK